MRSQTRRGGKDLFYRATSKVILAVTMIALHQGSAGIARAALIEVTLFANLQYDQTSINAPTTPRSAFFSMGGSFQNPSDFNNGSASFPGGSMNLPVQGTTFGFQSGLFPSLASLHATFPFGTYTITANNSVTSATDAGIINYAADYFPSTIPAVSGATYLLLHGIDPSQATTLIFNSHTRGPPTTNGNLVINIYFGSTLNAVYTTPQLGIATTSRMIPANTFQPNQSYVLELNFTDYIHATDTLNQTTTWQGFSVRTYVSFVTGAVPEPGGACCIALCLAGFVRRRQSANH